MDCAVEPSPILITFVRGIWLMKAKVLDVTVIASQLPSIFKVSSRFKPPTTKISFRLSMKVTRVTVMVQLSEGKTDPENCMAPPMFDEFCVLL